MNGSKTLNGLILQHLEAILDPGTSFRIVRYAMEIIQTADNAVKNGKILCVTELLVQRLSF